MKSEYIESALERRKNLVQSWYEAATLQVDDSVWSKKAKIANTVKQPFNTFLSFRIYNVTVMNKMTITEMQIIKKQANKER